MSDQESQSSTYRSQGNHRQSPDGKYRERRTLVLCFDGTNDVFDDTSTNIIRLFAALEKDRPGEQVVYYQPGIGTYVRAEAPWSPVLRDFAKTVDKGLAWYIGTHITGGYKFLMQHYSKGDRICLFGFSRGAFTARCLAGMLHKVGLLPRSNMEQVEFAYSLYESKDPKDIPRARKFKETFSSSVTVDFVGVWDTVSSVGFGAPLLPFNSSETFIGTFRHALAIDERRAKFQPNPWQYKQQCEICGSYARTQDSKYSTAHELNQGAREKEKEDKKLGREIVPPENRLCWCKDEERYRGGKLTDVLEVWFPGFHADVGGGNENNSVRKTLANPSLRWMVTEILKSDCDLVFREDAFKNWMPSLNAKILAFGAIAKTLPNPEEAKASVASIEATPVDEYTQEAEANSEQHDMLRDKLRWWLLEYIPLYQYWLGEDKQPTHGYRRNKARSRRIDQHIPYLHQSVQLRGSTYAQTSEGQCTFRENLRYIHEDEDLTKDVQEKLKGKVQPLRNGHSETFTIA